MVLSNAGVADGIQQCSATKGIIKFYNSLWTMVMLAKTHQKEPKSVNLSGSQGKLRESLKSVSLVWQLTFCFSFLLAYFKQNRQTENYSSKQKLEILPSKLVAWLHLYFWFLLTECSAQDACSISLHYFKSKSLKLPAAPASSRGKQSVSRR